MRAQPLQHPPDQGNLRRAGALLCGGRRLVALATVAALMVSGASLVFRRRERGGPLRFDREFDKEGENHTILAGGGRNHDPNVITLEEGITTGKSRDPKQGITVDVDGRVDVSGGAHHCWPEGKEKEKDLPRCYTSPDADPSAGAWRQCAGGIKESPVDMVNWAHSPQEYGFLHRCDAAWNTQHQGDGPRPYWDWKPEKCSLDVVTKESFCRAMEGRKGILLVGDSLTRLTTTTLASVLRARAIVSTGLKDVWKACGDKLVVRFMRNDYLDTRIERFVADMCVDDKGRRADNTRCTVFANDYTLKYFDTLVVNSGAHPRSAEEYGRAMKVASEDLTAKMKRLHGEEAILVVRNTPPGHWNCTARIFKGPVDKEVALHLVSEAPEKYGWDLFHGFNVQLEEAFAARDGWRLLDAYSPTYLRADNHIGGSDCLHYCVPGPADQWITLLFNMLLEATAGKEK